MYTYTLQDLHYITETTKVSEDFKKSLQVAWTSRDQLSEVMDVRRRQFPAPAWPCAWSGSQLGMGGSCCIPAYPCTGMKKDGWRTMPLGL